MLFFPCIYELQKQKPEVKNKNNCCLQLSLSKNIDESLNLPYCHKKGMRHKLLVYEDLSSQCMRP
jgi:hypothetical protein